MRVLIIKLTSMGDLMHALPALTDAANAIPDIEFDWVVDQAFSDVPMWHPNVKRVIKTSHRHWRKEPFMAWKEGHLTTFYNQLNEYDYDVVIDLQSNLKSAFVSWLRKGSVHGLDKNCCRERPAHWAYKYQYSVNLKQHSIEKMRALMAQILGYTRAEKPADYGVDLSRYELPELDFDLPERFMMFVHNASWLTKLWPLSHWQELVNHAVRQGYSVLLPCGNDDEYQRAQLIASVNPQAFALQRHSLNHMAALMQRAQAAVCSDTGLAHLAAVAGIPAVTVYGATDTQLIGTHGNNQHHIVSDFECAPCYKRQCPLEKSNHGEPVCMTRITAEQVWHRLESLLPAQ
ncbi:MAG: lipopolysaccharide heptosyltransferase I [Gammaproteobacteria bacterium]|nr:lipopolysaccharide heptosyltransferase I [Gammaproteobacteria bacterium]MDH5591576.1 lipopolysaccharide heptosyltransferase I [Gammaproteobacteria bacterium]